MMIRNASYFNLTVNPLFNNDSTTYLPRYLASPLSAYSIPDNFASRYMIISI